MCVCVCKSSPDQQQAVVAGKLGEASGYYTGKERIEGMITMIQRTVSSNLYLSTRKNRTWISMHCMRLGSSV